MKKELIDQIKQDYASFIKLGYSVARPRTSLPAGQHIVKITAAEIGTSEKNGRKRVYIRYNVQLQSGETANVLGGVELLDQDTATINVTKGEPREPLTDVERQYKDSATGLYTPFDTVAFVVPKHEKAALA